MKTKLIVSILIIVLIMGVYPARTKSAQAKPLQPESFNFNLREGDMILYNTRIDPPSGYCQFWSLKFVDIFGGNPEAAYVTLHANLGAGWILWDSRIINAGASMPEGWDWPMTAYGTDQWLTVSSTDPYKSTSYIGRCFISLPITFNSGQTMLRQNTVSESPILPEDNPYP